MGKRVTIYDIAEKLGISPSTVSRALSNSELVNRRTREMVLAAAVEMNYIDPKQLDRADTVAVIIPDMKSRFYLEVLAALQKSLQERYLVAVYHSFNSAKVEQEIVARLDLSRIHCLVVSQSMDTTDSSHLQEVQKKGVPLLLFHSVHLQQPSPRFIVDNYRDAYLLTNHLVTSGYHRIGFAASHFNCPINHERIRAFKDVLREHGIDFNPDYLIHSEQTVEDIHEVINRFLNCSPAPNAVILPNFTAALQAISIARMRSLSVPGDLAVVSFEDGPDCKYTLSSITTLEHPCAELGTAMGQYVASLNGNNTTNRELIKIFNSNLAIRGSSLAAT